MACLCTSASALRVSETSRQWTTNVLQNSTLVSTTWGLTGGPDLNHTLNTIKPPQYATEWFAKLERFPEDVVSRISSVWFTHPYPTEVQQKIVAGALLTLLTIGSVGNAFVTYMFFA
jgi:hypothetical protein